jgi:hypothetical protein
VNIAGSGTRPGGAPADNASLLDLAQRVALTTPGFVRMRRHPEFKDWRARVATVAARADLVAVGTMLTRVADLHVEGPETFAPMFEGIAADADGVDLNTLIHASDVAAIVRKSDPYTAFMLSWTTLSAWAICARRASRDLHQEIEQWPDRGWRAIPAACIAAAIDLQGIEGASLLVDEAYATVQTNVRRHPHHAAGLAPTIAEYRRLARLLATRQEMAIGALADDLRDACATNGRARRLLHALVWTLGLWPECMALRRRDEPPARPLLIRVIRLSFAVLSSDPLVQYAWLEMKAVPEIDLRAHESLYVLLNSLWVPWRMDDMYAMFGFEAEPSRIYVRTLERFLSGDLDQAGAAPFLQVYDYVTEARQTGQPFAYVRARFDVLRFLIGERFDFISNELTQEDLHVWLRDHTVLASRARASAAMFPEWPDAGGRTALAMHELVERTLAGKPLSVAAEQERCTAVVAALERFRTGALAYWLAIIPPTRPDGGGPSLDALLAEERELLDAIRGASFLALRTTLPEHFLWSELSWPDKLDLQDPERRRAFYSADGAREEKRALDTQLVALAERLASVAPAYAEARRSPAVDLARIATMLDRHRRS